MAEKRLLDKAEWEIIRSSSETILLGAWEQAGCRSWEKYRVSDLPNEYLTLSDIEEIPVASDPAARFQFVTDAMLDAGIEAISYGFRGKGEPDSYEEIARRVYHAMEAVRSAEEFKSAMRRSATDES